MLTATVLVDNTAELPYRGEWGLCIFIQFNDTKILLDTGASDLLIQNAKKLDIPLDSVDFGVLSHAHYDHANGMPAFFSENAHAPFYLRSACLENCYKRTPDGPEYIGIAKGTLSSYADRIIYVGDMLSPAPHVYLLPHTTPGLSEKGISEQMYRLEDNRWVPDDFSHEQSLVFELPDGLVIFNSCSHAGADVIIQEVSSAFPGKPILSLIGGFHLYNKSPEAIVSFAHRVRSTGISSLYTGHCTGDAAMHILRRELGNILQSFYTGQVLSFSC